MHSGQPRSLQGTCKLRLDTLSSINYRLPDNNPLETEELSSKINKHITKQNAILRESIEYRIN